MKTIILTIFSIFFLALSLPLHGEPKDFKVEKLITDYNGVVSNGSTVLCYGNYGIITISDDFGKTLRQINIGVDNHIKKIFAIGENYYGITSNSLIKSSDDGENWELYRLGPRREISSAALSGSDIYATSNDGVLKIDIENPWNLAKVMELNPDSLHLSIAVDDHYLYVTDGRGILRRQSLTSGAEDEIDIESMNLIENFLLVSNFKSRNGVLYAVAQSSVHHPLYGTAYYDSKHALIYSEDNGSNWSIYSDELQGLTCYEIIDEEIYTLGPLYEDGKLGVDYRKIPSPDKPAVKINSGDEIIRDIYYDRYRDNNDFSEILKIDENILIAVGKDKMISVSETGGANWRIASYFKTFYADNIAVNFEMQYLNKDTMIVPYFGYANDYVRFNGFLRTFDGGATWLPQLLDKNLEKPVNLSQYYFSETGSAISLFSNAVVQYYSGDFGETYETFEDSLEVASFQLSNNQPVEVDERILFPFRHSEGNNRFTKIYISDFKSIVDSVVIDSVTFKNIIKTPPGELFAFGLKQSNFVPPDNEYKWGHFEIAEYNVYESKDNGNSWSVFAEKLPLEKIPVIYGGTKHLADLTSEAYYYKGSLVIPYRTEDEETGKRHGFLCRYDLSEGKVETFSLDVNYGYETNSFFEFEGGLCYVTETGEICVSNSEEISDGFQLFKTEVSDNEYEVVYSARAGGYEGCLQLGSYHASGSFGGKVYKVNVGKFPANSEDRVTAISENPRDLSRQSNGDAYPNPASDYVRIPTGELTLNVSDVMIFDSFGVEIPLVSPGDVDIEESELIWNCSTVVPGIYFVCFESRLGRRFTPVTVVR